MANLRSFSASAVGFSEASVLACVTAAGDAQDRRVDAERQTRLRPGPPVKRPAAHYGFTPHEFHVFGILRTRHGMSQEQAARAVLRARQAAPRSGA